MRKYEINGKTIIFGDYIELHTTMGTLPFTKVCNDRIDPNKFYIIYDKNFMKLSEESQKFILFHELGHIINGDLEGDNASKISRIRNILRFLNISNKAEFAADKFAVKRTSKKVALNAFWEMKRINIFISSLDLIQRAIVIIFG